MAVPSTITMVIWLPLNQSLKVEASHKNLNFPALFELVVSCHFIKNGHKIPVQKICGKIQQFLYQVNFFTFVQFFRVLNFFFVIFCKNFWDAKLFL